MNDEGSDRTVEALSRKVDDLLAQSLQLASERITDDLTMDDVQSWDSLRHMELIVAIEQAFGLELSFEDIVTMRSVGEIKRVLRQKIAVT
jgi:acyl carrier protein